MNALLTSLEALHGKRTTCSAGPRSEVSALEQKVTVVEAFLSLNTRWLMFDTDHPDQIGKTRGGLWEIHAITKIEVFSGGGWVEL